MVVTRKHKGIAEGRNFLQSSSNIPYCSLLLLVPLAVPNKELSARAYEARKGRWPPLRATQAFALACLLELLPDGNSGKPKADIAVPVGRRMPVAVLRAAPLGTEAPGAAPVNPGADPFSPDVPAPLQHVAMHVVQSQFVRRIRAHF